MEDERDLSPKQMEGTPSTPEPREDGELESLRLRYEAGESLSDEEVDRIADIAVTYVKSLLSYFGETQVAIDEYDGDEGELILDVSGGKPRRSHWSARAHTRGTSDDCFIFYV